MSASDAGTRAGRHSRFREFGDELGVDPIEGTIEVAITLVVELVFGLVFGGKEGLASGQSVGPRIGGGGKLAYGVLGPVERRALARLAASWIADTGAAILGTSFGVWPLVCGREGARRGESTLGRVGN